MHPVALTLVVLVGLIILLRGYIIYYDNEVCVDVTSAAGIACTTARQNGALMTLVGLILVGYPLYMIIEKQM